jgi:hypothetical protein
MLSLFFQMKHTSYRASKSPKRIPLLQWLVQAQWAYDPPWSNPIASQKEHRSSLFCVRPEATRNILQMKLSEKTVLLRDGENSRIDGNFWASISVSMSIWTLASSINYISKFLFLIYLIWAEFFLCTTELVLTVTTTNHRSQT